MLSHLFQSPAFLGFFAGATIFLGLPIARLGHITPRTKAFLNALSTGILIFLLVEITGHLMEEVEEMVESAVVNGVGAGATALYGGLFVAGFSIGLLGLVLFEQRFLGRAKDQVAPAKRSKQLALLIAVGLGLHNLSEGLAIGQGYASGAVQLAWLLAIGFALHNATEGFGVAAPLSGHRASWGFLAWCGLLAGGPTFIGAAAGSAWVSKPAEIFCLALAAGTILYIVGELLHLGRQLKGEAVVSIGLLVGFFVAMSADFTLSAAMEKTATHGPRHGGYFGDANDLYHYELLRDSKQRLILYVNDHYNRPMDARTLEGRWTINPDGPHPVTGFFQPAEGGRFLVSRLPAGQTADSTPIKIEVLKGKDWAGMDFLLPPAKD